MRWCQIGIPFIVKIQTAYCLFTIYVASDLAIAHSSDVRIARPISKEWLMIIDRMVIKNRTNCYEFGPKRGLKIKILNDIEFEKVKLATEKLATEKTNLLHDSWTNIVSSDACIKYIIQPISLILSFNGIMHGERIV